MGAYKISIKIDGTPIDNSQLIITDNAFALFDFTFSDLGHTSVGFVKIGTSALQTAHNLDSTFYLDYNLAGSYLSAVEVDTVIIRGDFAELPTVITPNEDVIVTIETELSDLGILSKIAQTADSNICNLVDVFISASKDFNELIQPYSESFPDTNYFIIKNVARNSIIFIQIKNSNNQIASTNYTSPGFLNEGKLTASVAWGSVVINDVTIGLSLRYSLDNIVYQDSNSFPGLLNGDYTCYVKDQFGCIATIDFTINIGQDGTIIIPEPYFKYPRANCLRVAKREVWNDSTVFKNDDNTLSCESTDRVVHTEKQRWRTTDTINLQVKNNYSDLLMELSNDIGNAIPLIQKSTNLNNKEAMDCKLTDLGNSTIGIYFISGQTYDYDSMVPIGNYSLNGTLPAWGKKGNIVTINAFNYEIVDITYNESLQTEQLIIIATIPDGDYISKAIYNIFDYEVYELAIILTLETTPFNLRINYDGKLQYVSELIYPDNNTLNLLSIRYYMDYNTDMFWSTGIQPVIRLQQDLNNASSKRDSESYDTDETSIQIKVNNYRVVIIKFLPTTKQFTVNCLEIFSSSNINIMGINYRCESIEMESLEESNLYVLTVTMQEKDSGIVKNSIGSTTITLPKLISTESGYIKL